MATITKKQLVAQISETTKTPQSTAKSVVQRLLDEIIGELAKDNRLEFRDFGVFEVRLWAARAAQNPKTMEPVQVPAKKVVKFKMGRALKEKLNNNTTMTRITKQHYSILHSFSNRPFSADGRLQLFTTQMPVISQF